MSYVEVDTKLFITCRLCLEESGTYQIVPAIQTQIRYCFDINVEPFDGLPQLICKKCQTILSYISKTKETFIQRQDDLKKKIQENTLPQEDTPQEIETEPIGKTDNHVIIKTEDWKKKYRKTYRCTLCCSEWFASKSVMFHAAIHQNIKKKHAGIFNRYCTVSLPKIDAKPNITGSLKKVVYSEDKIIAKGNTHYNIAYKYIRDGSISGNVDNEPSIGLTNDENSESTDTIVPRRKLKRKRISSRSSTDTVVLENKSNASDHDESDKKPQKENECISIDDTDSDEEKAETQENSSTNNDETKANALKRLIASTAHRYVKKHEKPTKQAQTFGQQLKRKILSIGRKIVNKQGLNCTGVIKFLENVNLDMIWLPRSPLNVTSSSNYLKIVARMRNPHEKNLNDFEGYTKKYDRGKEVPRICLDEPSSSKDTELMKALNNVDKTGMSSTVNHDHHYSNGADAVQPGATLTTPEPIASYGLSVSAESDAAMLYSISAADTQKLLNANPVANPKQLPKKFTTTETKTKVKYPKNMPSLEVVVNPEEVYEGDDVMIEMQMPIITSTTSLAVNTQNEIPSTNNESSDSKLNVNTTSSSNNVDQNPIVPRIKVKSVAELMSKETLSRMNEPAATSQAQQMTYNRYNLNSNTTESSTASHPVTVSAGAQSNDYLILDTVELPNTKTYSPFAYFKSLLAMHNITLLDTEATLTGEFHTLVKFKVLYHQETKDHVVLCLSLFCSNNVFCLKIKDRNDENINMAKISANWQWEILKIYKGEVVTKLLGNAQKINQEVFKYTNSFLCLLKSINFVTK